MKLIVGLGNPGLRYKNTRHNIGFLVIDNFLKVNRGKIDKNVVLLKPHLFMNNSGRAVKKAIDRLKLDVEDVLIVCDDINLELGIIRFRAKGSAGGHRGLQSIIETLGTEDFNRLRIGIGAKERAVLRDYVLSKFKPGEKQMLREVVAQATEAIGVWIEDGIEAAMNRYNGKNLGVIASEPRRGERSNPEARLLRQPPSAASSQ